MDVGQDTSLGNGHSGQELVELLVIADGQLQVTGDDTSLLVIAGSVTCELKNLRCQVLDDGSQVHGGTSTNALSIVALAKMPVNLTNGELVVLLIHAFKFVFLALNATKNIVLALNSSKLVVLTLNASKLVFLAQDASKFVV